MAISKTIEITRFGGAMMIHDAYCFAQDIKTVQVDRRIGSTETGEPIIERSWRLRFVLLCYTSKEAKDNNASPLETVMFDEPAPNVAALGPNAIAYFVAKTDARFAGAVDC